MAGDRGRPVMLGLVLGRGLAWGSMIDQFSSFGLPRGVKGIEPKTEWHDGPRLGRVVRQGQRRPHDVELDVWLIRRPGGVAEWKVGECSAGRIGRRGDGPGRGQRCGDDAGGFECSCDQPN